MKKVVIIGAGPAGLFASYLLLAKGYSVDLYDQKKEPGRKLLLAGKSGLNITNTIEPELFIEAYGNHKKEIFPALSKFSPKDLRTWLSSIGIKTLELKWKGREIQGDLTITAYGIEGGPIYHFSREIRNSLEQLSKENIILDLLPDLTEEAISSSGGISFTELDGHFMLKKFPGWFTAGEMIDWDAPTGGYLLQGCFSTAYMAVEGISKYKN